MSPLFAGVLAIVVIGAIKVLLRHRLSQRHSTSLDLAIVSIGFFLILMMRLPVKGTHGWMGMILFLSCGALYKLLGYFEEP